MGHPVPQAAGQPGRCDQLGVTLPCPSPGWHWGPAVGKSPEGGRGDGPEMDQAKGLLLSPEAGSLPVLDRPWAGAVPLSLSLLAGSQLPRAHFQQFPLE